MTIKELEKNIKDLSRRMSDMDQIIRDMNEQRKDISKKISEYKKEYNAKTKPIIITDHAILRFAERRYGVDIEGVKQQILSEIGDIPITSANVNGYIIRDKTVVTYVPQPGDACNEN